MTQPNPIVNQDMDYPAEQRVIERMVARKVARIAELEALLAQANETARQAEDIIKADRIKRSGIK